MYSFIWQCFLFTYIKPEMKHAEAQVKQNCFFFKETNKNLIHSDINK